MQRREPNQRAGPSRPRGSCSRTFTMARRENLNELLNFYNQRFQMNLSDEEKSDLIAFLNSL